MNSVKQKFYVYAYLDPRKPGEFRYGDVEFECEPFYIGKGKGNRYKQKREYNHFFCNKAKKIEREISRSPIVRKIKKRLTEEEAFDLEIELIEIIGRVNKGTGPLTNLTDGGAGGSGAIISEAHKRALSKARKGKPLSLEHRKKLSESHKGNPGWNKGKKTGFVPKTAFKKGIIPWIKGKKHTKETRKKMSKAWENRIVSDETRQKMAKTLRGRKMLEETKRKISRTLKGQKFTEERCRRISEGQRGRVPWNKGLNKEQMVNERLRRGKQENEQTTDNRQ